MPWFQLRRIDTATKSFTHEVHFATDEVASIAETVGNSDMKAGDFYELSAAEYVALVERFELDLPREADLGEIFWHYTDDFDRRPTHSGRELLLMLEGKKPFAAFVDEANSRDQQIIPEDLFEPHVQAGRFAKRVSIYDYNLPNKLPIKMRRVMYAVVGQEWRFDAFLMLWAVGAEKGWNEGLEKVEGFLYGYETEIDPYFKKKNI
jgi:hypothetical protein